MAQRKREILNEGVNDKVCKVNFSQQLNLNKMPFKGNPYVAYDDGAYRYKNQDGGRYFNDGRDHGFYRNTKGTKASGGVPYEKYFDYKNDRTRTTCLRLVNHYEF